MIVVEFTWMKMEWNDFLRESPNSPIIQYLLYYPWNSSLPYPLSPAVWPPSAQWTLKNKTPGNWRQHQPSRMLPALESAQMVYLWSENDHASWSIHLLPYHYVREVVPGEWLVSMEPDEWLVSMETFTNIYIAKLGLILLIYFMKLHNQSLNI